MSIRRKELREIALHKHLPVQFNLNLILMKKRSAKLSRRAAFQPVRSPHQPAGSGSDVAGYAAIRVGEDFLTSTRFVLVCAGYFVSGGKGAINWAIESRGRLSVGSSAEVGEACGTMVGKLVS
jgi:hypothetical protein